ncbi:MAG: hypothetical protein AAGA85_06505 [Bacteroidota bacterium]
MLIKIIDFGLVVLIWMVQLVVYPSFQYYDKASLLKWHGPYTQNITYIVMPLMLGQLVLHGMKLVTDFNIFRLIIFILVLGTWATTFFYAVPLHGKIGSGIDVTESVQSLIRSNWIRTALWTLIFLGSYFLLPGNQGPVD